MAVKELEVSYLHMRQTCCLDVLHGQVRPSKSHKVSVIWEQAISE